MARETVICDSSFVGLLTRQETTSGSSGRRDEVFTERIETASLAISVVTVAEARAGYLKAGWGGSRVAAAERHLRRFDWIPVERSHVDEWARLRVAAKRRGVALSDNDLWIATTASVREQALVTCDRDHQRIAAELPVEVVFLAPPV